MGMYTQLHFAATFKKETPEEVIEIIEFMANNHGDDSSLNLPSHEFFSCDRWKFLFLYDSYYFDYKTHCKFFKDDIADQYYLCVTSNLKNYNNEIEKFIDWIKPYLDKHDGNFLGYLRYEETEEPTLIYF